MSTAAEILKGVSVHRVYQPYLEAAYFDEEVGFIRDREDARTNEGPQAMLYGFGWAGWQRNTIEAGDFLGITSLEQIDPALRTVGRQGRGTGARMYNTPQAALGAMEDVAVIGLYAFNVDTQKLENKQTSPMRQRARSAGLLLASKLLGDERAVEAFVNRETADYHGLIYSQTPDGEKQKRQKYVSASVVPERLMVIRKPNTYFQKVGSYAVSKS